MSSERADVVVVGAGHNGLVAATLLARAGLSVVVLEEKGTVGGAAKTERPFRKVPGLATLGITGGHIHHVDNTFGFDDRLPYAQPLSGLYSCSAGCHPAGSVIGAAGHNAARRVLRDLGKA
jgi:phytoene dehydrogenase-like protein